MPICLITSTHIQKYVNELATSGYGLSTIKKQMRIVTAPLKQAAALHQIPANPAVGIKLPARCNIQKTEQQAEAYSPEEQEALLRVLNTHSRPGFAAIILMMETGLRVGEALALQWKDIQILCFVSGIKQKDIATMQVQKKWLEDLSSLLRNYMVDYVYHSFFQIS